MNSVRLAVLAAIAAIDAGNIHAQAALANTGLAGAERNLASELLYGHLRARSRLRQILSEVLAKPRKLPPGMLIALEQAVYALFFQDKTADYAVVNETVKLVKKRFGQKLANVANGALRNLQTMTFTPPGPDARLRDWANFYAMPVVIAELWRQAYGREAAIALMRRGFQRPYNGLRVNLTRQEGATLLTMLRNLEYGVAVGHAGVAFPPGQMPRMIFDKDMQMLEHEGCLSFQAAGSQLVLANLGLYEDWKGNVPIWDACAGFGGKTLALLEAGLPVRLATDISSQRLAHLAPQVARLGLAAPAAMLADAMRPPFAEWPGHILLDVPCSGLGVLGRRPDIKGRFDPGNVSELLAAQRELLAYLAGMLKPGRELAYITCALNPAENEKQIDKVLKLRPNLEICASWQTPHDHPWLEGMYGCRLRRGG